MTAFPGFHLPRVGLLLTVLLVWMSASSESWFPHAFSISTGISIVAVGVYGISGLTASIIGYFIVFIVYISIFWQSIDSYLLLYLTGSLLLLVIRLTIMHFIIRFVIYPPSVRKIVHGIPIIVLASTLLGAIFSILFSTIVFDDMNLDISGWVIHASIHVAMGYGIVLPACVWFERRRRLERPSMDFSFPASEPSSGEPSTTGATPGKP